MYRAKALNEYTKEMGTVKNVPKKRNITKRDWSANTHPPEPKRLQLTNKHMLKMSNCDGLAITRIWGATFYHMTSGDKNPHRFYCSDSWCKYQQLKAEYQQVINFIKLVY